MEVGADELALIEGPTPEAEWSGAACVGLYLSRRGEANLGEFWFGVDEVTFYGLDAWQLRDEANR